MRKDKNRKKISYLLIKKILSIYFLVVAFITIFQLAIEYSQTQSAIRQELQELEKGFAESITTALWAENAAQIAALANGILNLSIVTGIEIESEQPILSVRKFQTGISDLFHRFDLNYSFEKSSFSLGRATVYSDHSVVFERVKVGFFLLLFSALIKSIILTALFIWAINKFLKKPLLRFTDQIETVDIEKIDKSLFDMNTENSNELYRLNEVFGKMHRKIGEHIENITEMKELYQNIFDHVQVGIYQMDFDGRLLKVNMAMSKIGGYASEKDMLDTVDNLKDLIAEHEHENFINQIRKDGALTSEINLISKNGHQITCELSAFAIFDRQGEPILIEGMLQDLSEKKSKEKALREKEGAIAANKAKSQFLATMSHELRTPLNAILGFSQIMAHSKSLNSEQKENLQIINRSGEHLLTLINDVLDLSKIEAGQAILLENDFDLYRLLDDIQEMFKAPVNQKGLKLLFEYKSEVPQFIRTDEVKLRQVLINLISNAVKFTQEGWISVKVTARSQEDRSHRISLHFEVEDTGPGIASTEFDHIFDAFWQTQTVKDAGEGTGLGLSISQKFVQLMGGIISLDSQVETDQRPGGSIFRFDVQVQKAKKIHIVTETPARRVIGLEPTHNKYRVLIADDIMTNRQVLMTLLAPLGLEIKEAANGQEVIEVWKEWSRTVGSPHLIWLDMQMPKKDGYEVIKEIRNDELGNPRKGMRNNSLIEPITTNRSAEPHEPRIGAPNRTNHESQVLTKIISISASAFEADKQKAFEAGCDGFVRKPFKESEIFEEMAKHLGLKYVYEAQSVQEAPQTEQPAVHQQIQNLDLHVIQMLSDKWKLDMKQAIEHVDLEQIEVLIEQLREEHETLANAFQKQIDRFEYEEVLAIFEEMKEEK